jgi:hypothetical protein
LDFKVEFSYDGLSDVSEFSSDVSVTNALDIVTHYTFNDGTAADQSGNGYDGNVNGATSVSDGGPQSDGSFSFTTDDYITHPDSSVLDGKDAITISFWWKPDTLGSSNQGLVVGRQGQWNNLYGFRYIGGDNELQFAVENGTFSNTEVRVAESNITVGAWNHVTGVFDGSSGFIKVYIDGGLAGEETNPPASQTGSDGLLSVGRTGGQGEYLEGDLDEIRLFDTAISESDNQSIYDDTK